jgi:hypothetical protein
LVGGTALANDLAAIAAAVIEAFCGAG